MIILALDTTSDQASVAVLRNTRPTVAVSSARPQELARGVTIWEEVVSASDGHSYLLYQMIESVLLQAAVSVLEVDCFASARGPGSFTGTRICLAAAKGLCEAASLRFVTVARLAVLADVAALTDGLAVLDAGRGELYVRDAGSGREWLCAVGELPEAASGGIVVAERRIAERLAVRAPLLHPLRAGDALSTVLRTLAAGGSDVAFAEANYVRGEQNIYAKPVAGSGAGGSR